MTLFDLLNTDLKKLNDVLDADKDLASAFDNLCDRIGYMMEGGRIHWQEVDHELNCPNCKEKVTVH